MLYFGLSMGVLFALHEVCPEIEAMTLMHELTFCCGRQVNPGALQSKVMRSALRRVGGASAAEKASAEQQQDP